MDDRKNYTGLIWLIITVLALVFFWFEWRPASIKKSCMSGAKEAVIRMTNLSDTYVADTVERQRIQLELTDDLYRDCLREKGL